MKTVYIETHVVNAALKDACLEPRVRRWLAGNTPLVSEIVLLEVASTSNADMRHRLLKLVGSLLTQPSSGLQAIRCGKDVPVMRTTPIVASPWEMFCREVKAFLAGSDQVRLDPSDDYWRDYIETPERVDDATAERLRNRKDEEERKWWKLHKQAYNRLKMMALPAGSDFLDAAVTPEGRKRFFETLFGVPCLEWGCAPELLPELFRGSAFCRALYYGFVYSIDRYGMKGTSNRQSPVLDVWDVLQTGYLAYSDIALVGRDLFEFFCWVAEAAEISCRVIQITAARDQAPPP